MKSSCTKTIIAHPSRIYSIIMMQDDRLIASSSSDCSIKIWSFFNGKQIRSFIGHNSTIWNIISTHDCRFLISGARDSTIKVWRIISGEQVYTFLKGAHSSDITCVSISLDNKKMFSVSIDHKLIIWKTRTKKIIKSNK